MLKTLLHIVQMLELQLQKLRTFSTCHFFIFFLYVLAGNDCFYTFLIPQIFQDISLTYTTFNIPDIPIYIQVCHEMANATLAFIYKT